MSPSATLSVIERATAGRRLLCHPYYRAWQHGELTRDDLRGYAQQYRHFEMCLPVVLGEAASKMTLTEARRMVEANLADELSSPRSHLELFDDFAAALGAAGHVDPTYATHDLVRLYGEAAEAGPAPALAVIAAYETQASDIAATKAASLSQHYGLDGRDTEFWRIHAVAEQDHSEWTTTALELLGASADVVELWAARSAGSWWTFLDERELERAA